MRIIGKGREGKGCYAGEDYEEMRVRRGAVQV